MGQPSLEMKLPCPASSLNYSGSQGNWLVNHTTDGFYFAAFHIRVCQDSPPRSWYSFSEESHIHARGCPLLVCTFSFLFTLPCLTLPCGVDVCTYIGISSCIRVQHHLPYVYRENVSFVALSIEDLIFFLLVARWDKNYLVPSSHLSPTEIFRLVNPLFAQVTPGNVLLPRWLLGIGEKHAVMCLCGTGEHCLAWW